MLEREYKEDSLTFLLVYTCTVADDFLALQLWEFSQNPVHAALVASAVCTALLESCDGLRPRNASTELWIDAIDGYKDRLKRMALSFRTRARRMIELSGQQQHKENSKLLGYAWGSQRIVRLALAA